MSDEPRNKPSIGNALLGLIVIIILTATASGAVAVAVKLWRWALN